jgi:hypothetical protein
MNVGELITKLQKLDPETLVVKFNKREGYDDILFIDGSHNSEAVLKVNRTIKFVRGYGKPDYLYVDEKTKAKKFNFVVMY